MKQMLEKTVGFTMGSKGKANTKLTWRNPRISDVLEPQGRARPEELFPFHASFATALLSHTAHSPPTAVCSDSRRAIPAFKRRHIAFFESIVEEISSFCYTLAFFVFSLNTS